MTADPAHIPPIKPDSANTATTVPRCANVAFMLSHPLHIVSLGFGSGLSPVAPGTAGTLFAWLTFNLLNRYLHPGTMGWIVLIAIGFFAGIAITGFTAEKMGTDDPSPVVWDEIVAFWLVMFVMSRMMPAVGFISQLVAFIAFRFFDMVKPPPIRYFDRNIKGGFGIMFDDLVAALFALIVIFLWCNMLWRLF